MSSKTKGAPQSDRFKIIAAASAALPIGEWDVQAFGGRLAWNREVRPRRIAARMKAISFLVRAAERAREDHSQLSTDQIEAALRSLALNSSDLLICPTSGDWLSGVKAVKHRGEEVSRAIAELAFVVRSVEMEKTKR